MRTAIFLGLILIAKSINPIFISNDSFDKVAYLCAAFLVIDIIEFVKYLTKD